MKKTIFSIKEKVDYEIANNIIKPEGTKMAQDGKTYQDLED